LVLDGEGPRAFDISSLVGSRRGVGDDVGEGGGLELNPVEVELDEAGLGELESGGSLIGGDGELVRALVSSSDIGSLDGDCGSIEGVDVVGLADCIILPGRNEDEVHVPVDSFGGHFNSGVASLVVIGSTG